MSKIIFLGIDVKPIALLQRGYAAAKLYDPKDSIDYVFFKKKWCHPIISYNDNAIFVRDGYFNPELTFKDYYLKIPSTHKLYSYLKEMLSIDELPK